VPLSLCALPAALQVLDEQLTDLLRCLPDNPAMHERVLEAVFSLARSDTTTASLAALEAPGAPVAVQASGAGWAGWAGVWLGQLGRLRG
jgi:hypothetical protein